MTPERQDNPLYIIYYMKTMLTMAVLLLGGSAAFANTSADSIRGISLQEVEIVSTPKELTELRQQPTASTSLSHLRRQQINSIKDVGTLVPNLFIPDYGSRLTSAVYVRGVGSRIGTPAVAMYVDNVPYADKSGFDFNFFDIERIDVLRGPQATLYGRNAMGGIIKVHTKNPFRYQGTDVRLGYASGDNHATASLTHYHRVNNKMAFSAGAYGEHGRGFFTNSTTGRSADRLTSAGGRMRGIILPKEGLRLDLSVSYDHTNQRINPYYYDGAVPGVAEAYPDLIGQISANRPNTYRRSLLNAGINIQYQGRGWELTSITGYQRLRDNMQMDQDFLRADIYTLVQKQHAHSFNEELILRSKRPGKYQWLNGLNLMGQQMKTRGPVTFHADGMQFLQQNINGFIPSVQDIPAMAGMGFQSMSVNLRDDRLYFDGTYRTPIIGAALFHQSTWAFHPRWQLTAGLRLDYEHQRLDYDAPALVNYGFSMLNNRNPMMNISLPDQQADVSYTGELSRNQWNLLPRIALQHTFSEHNNIYASASFGQRSGGYNLQMFSDLMQGAMRGEMIEGIKQGVYEQVKNTIDAMPVRPGMPDMSGIPDMVGGIMEANMPSFPRPEVSQLEYDPETSWTFELGTHLRPHHRLDVDAAVFYSFIQDQQISRFADNGLGRMMVNAGRSRSCGGELSATVRATDALTLQANYGFTHAVFREFDDGKHDYKGNYVPFIPAHTLSAEAAYRFDFRNRNVWNLTLALNTQGHGRLYWTEDNSMSQNFQAQLGARALLQTRWGNLCLWGRNLTANRYDAFRFISVDRVYHQRNTPLQVGVDLTLRL